jgi:hypothetical protein
MPKVASYTGLSLARITRKVKKFIRTAESITKMRDGSQTFPIIRKF